MVALTVEVGSPNVLFANALNVIVWFAFIVKLCGHIVRRIVIRIPCLRRRDRARATTGDVNCIGAGFTVHCPGREAHRQTGSRGRAHTEVGITKRLARQRLRT